MKFKGFLFLFLLICNHQIIYAQLCRGSLGDPVVNITFGSGSNPGAALNSATTNYTYVSTDCPNDGMYALRNQTLNCYNSWHSLYRDHTGNTNGYFMVVNASFQPSAFFLETVSGLCGNTTYEFAAWIMNLMVPVNSIKPNITFSIEKKDGTVIKTYNSGDINVTPSGEWKQYGFYFTTPPNGSDVVIRMTNNAPGGIGNDLALDDITFRPCGPEVKIEVNNSTVDTIHTCEGYTTAYNLQASVSEGYNSTAYQWQMSIDSGATWKDIAGANSATFLRQPTSGGLFQYRLTVSEGGNIGISNCRIASSPIYINVHKKPEVHFVNEGPVCEGGSTNLTATVSFFGSQQGELLWSYPATNLNNVTITEVSNAGENSTTYTASIQRTSLLNKGIYKVNALNNWGCSNEDSTTLVVYNKPLASFNVPMPLCNNKEILFENTSTVAAQSITAWSWNFGNGILSKERNPAVLFSSSNTTNVFLFVTTDKGCVSDTVSKSLTIHPAPKVNFALPKVCLSDPFALFTDSTTISDNSNAQLSYLWTFNDPLATASNPNTSNVKNPQHKYGSTGMYNTTLKVTSKDGCIGDTTKVFTVNGAVPKADFTVNSASPFCSENNLVLTNQSSVDFGDINKVAIFWVDNNTSTLITDESPEKGKSYSFNYDKLLSGSSENYTIRLAAYSGKNCVNELTKTVKINKSPQISFGTIPEVCEEVSPFVIHNASEITGISGKGFYSGSGVEASGLFYPKGAGRGNHSIMYKFTSDAGCMAQKENTVTVYAQPTVSAGPDKYLIKGGKVYLNGSSSSDVTTYVWTPQIAIDNATLLRPLVQPAEEMVYTLTVTNGNGCTNKDEVLVTVIKEFYIPNAFTPNGDGKNDVWRIPSLESFPGAEVFIYNRYGGTVFHAKEADVAWNGLFKGSKLPIGTYVYFIDLKNGEPVLSGTIQLIR